MAYTKHQWAIGEAITQDLMNNIEKGIYDAHVTADSKVSQQELNNITSGISDSITGHENRITIIEGDMETVTNAAGQFSDIVSEVQSAHRNDVANDRLEQRFVDDETAIGNAMEKATSIETIVKAAYEQSANIVANNGIERKAQSLLEKITDMESKISTATQYANSAMAILNPQVEGQRSIAQRVTDLDGDTTPSMNVPSIITELTNARGLSANNTPNETLSARFIADEDRISLLENGLGQRVRYNDVRNGLTYNETNYPLSAYQGQVLAGMIAQAESDAVTTAKNYADANKIDIQSIANNLNTSAIVTGQVLDARQGAALNTRLENVETELANAHVTGESTSLDARFDSIDGGSAPTRTLPNVIEELENARVSHAVQWNDNGTLKDTEYASLDARLEAIESTNATLDTNLDTRLDYIDGGSNPARTLQDVTTEVENARSSTVKGTEDEITHEVTPLVYNTVDERLEAIETDIDAIATELDMYNVADQITGTTSRIDTIETNLVTMAKEIGMLQDEEIVVDLSNAVSRANTRIDTIDGRVETLEDEVGDAHRLHTGIFAGEEGQEEEVEDTLQLRFESGESRISALESEISIARGGETNLDTRLDNLDYTLSHESTQEDQTTGMAQHIAALETEMSNGRDTFNDIDARFDNIETDVDTINDTLGTGFDTTTNTVAAKIAEAITTAEAYTDSQNTTNKVGQIDEANREHSGHFVEDEETHEQVEVADTLDLRFDDIEGRLDALDTPSTGAIAGLTGRVGALETSVDTQTTGLKDRMTAAETAINHVKDANDANDKGGLEQRMDAAEAAIATKAASSIVSGLQTTVGNLSTTIVLASNQVNFDENNKPTTLKSGEIEDKNDYLIQNPEDEKYYYWKHINDAWHLMGGAGGGGTGTSSAIITDTLPAVSDADLNTDYYIGTPTTGYTHYRFNTVYDEDLGQDVTSAYIIGQSVDTSKIKRYNMERIYDENSKKYYLKLYQYDYNLNNNDVDTDLSAVLPWVASTSYVVDDLVLYTDGYVYKCIAANSDAEWTTANWTKVSDINTIQMVELPEGGGGGGASTGVVKRLTRIGDQSIETITGTRILLQVFYSYHTTTLDENNNIIPEESSAGSYVLTSGGTTIATGIIASGAYKASVSTYQENTPGYMQFDVTEYCNVGNNSFSLTVTTNGEQQTKGWSVKVIDLRLESEAPEVLLIASNEAYEFPYKAIGALTKTLHVVIDNDTEHEITTTLSSLTSGRNASIEIPAQKHGAHKIEMYLTATIGGVPQTTPSIIREYIWYDENNTTVPLILASPYDGQTITAQQYSTIEIPYQVYKKGASSITVKYYADDVLFNSVVLEETNIGTLSYAAVTKGSHTLKIMVDDDAENALTINLSITELPMDVSPVDGAIIDFDPTMLSNTSTGRLPQWTVGANTYSLTASPNFNWSEDVSGGGYKTDVDGKCFIIKAGSYVDLDYPMFSGDSNNNILTRGAEMKIIFKTDAVRSADAVWFTNTGSLYDKDVGLQLGVHSGWLKTTKAVNDNIVIEPDENGIINISGAVYQTWQPNTSYNVNDIVVIWDEDDEDNHEVIYRCVADWDDTHATFLNNKGKVQTDYWLKIGKINTEIASTDSYLYMPYSEQDKIELDINVNRYDSNASTNFIMSYEDGVPSKVYAYSAGSGGDGLYHNNTIRIGSNDCDVYIYRLRIYNKSLDTADILQNFIADGKDIAQKKERHDRNCIYWNSIQEKYFTTPSSEAMLDPVKLAEVMPDVKILMLDTPVLTTGKKDFIKNSTLRCIHADGGKVFTSRGDADNWFFTDGFHAGQGTTSDNYGQAGRNIDFLFEVDGVHWPTKSKNMANYKPADYPDYKSKVYIGKNASKWVEIDEDRHIYEWQPNREATEQETCDDWKGDNCKISLTETSVPNNYFNLKVNIASSENVNNALFQKRYNDFLAYTSPAQTTQIRKHRLAYQAMGLDTDKITVKNVMEFVPAVLFIRENKQDANGNPVDHVEFNDCDWHFYALGNIGDSKKTDYTRAYDPDDMNEFTCENSDNNTNNGQFQSGVFVYEGHNAIETDYRAWSESVAYETGSIVIYNGTIYQRTGETQAELEEGTTYSWVAADWAAVTYTGWTDSEPPYFAPRVNPNPMDYIYPITPSQWNVKLNDTYLNRKHLTLVTEAFDGDHSFEFRYGCRGDYRDGDLINVSDGQDDDAQFNINHDVILALYEWVITATKEQYMAEAPEWFVKPAMEFFYAYTHYYTMMDNRAKNTFWHFAKTGEYRRVSRPVEALYHVYKVADGNVTTDTNGVCTGTFIDPTGEFDPTATYYTQYAFDLWVYDCDTAAGIDNNGELAFPYGKEDSDYRIENVPTSGYAFNGAGSIFWRRLKAAPEDGGFANEIAEIMNTTDINCFSASNLLNEFDAYQNCFPEEIWRLDIERKYIRTFTGESIDNSITTGKQNPRFLTSMMQGRKKYQRRQWIRNQSLYFNSKYRLKDVTVASNTVEFNIITPADVQNLAVTPNYDLKLTPYQDMYLNVTIGNGGPTPSIRAKAGKTYTIPMAEYGSGTFGETRIYIYGFSGISGIGNLAPMYPYKFTLNALERLKVLDIGTENSGYVNANLTALPFAANSNLPLLETLNIKNCHSLGGGLALNQANNLRVLEAAGSSITGVNLPQYTNIETLHLPTSVTDVVLYGARKLTDFKVFDNSGNVDYSSLYKLNIYDSDYSSEINWMSIASDILPKNNPNTDIELLKLNLAHIGDIQELEEFSEFRKPEPNTNKRVEFSGIINVLGTWSDVEKNYYAGTPSSVWPSLTLDTTNGTYREKCSVTYKYDDYEDDEGNIIQGEEIKTIYVNRGDPLPDIYVDGTLTEMPTRQSTAKYIYQFGLREYGNYQEYSGWKLVGSEEPISASGSVPPVATSMTVETYFRKTKKTYYVRWFMKENDNSTLVKTSLQAVDYGGGENLEAPTVAEIHAAHQKTYDVTYSGGSVNYSIFTGWEKLPTNINPNASDTYYDIYATWRTYENVPLIDLFEDTSNLTVDQLAVYSALPANMRSTYVGNKIKTNTRFNLEMGHDSIKPGTVLIGKNNTLGLSNGYLRLTKTLTEYSGAIKTNIQPFKANNDAFTFVIDYQFNSNVTYDSGMSAVLAGSYYENTQDDVINGFALYYNNNNALGGVGPRVGFGDWLRDASYSVAVGNELTNDLRNIVVIRHPKDSDTLYVYSGLGGSNSLNTSVVTQSIPYGKTNSDAYLWFGRLTDNTSYTDVQNATKKGIGTIYYSKFWNEDLGVGECKRLAAWPHETMTYAIYGLGSGVTSGTPADAVTPVPSIAITSITASNHGRIVQTTPSGSADGTTIGWSTSTARTICNSRVLPGLPTELQAILSKPSLKFYNAVYTSAGQYAGSTFQKSANTTTSTDYIFLLSASNLDINNANGSEYYNETSNVSYESAPFEWLDDINVTLYLYDPNNSTVGSWNQSSGTRSSYLNLRFPIKPVGTQIRVFRESASIPSSTTIKDAIVTTGSIQSGDIFISNNGTAYIYVTDEEIQQYGILTEPTSGNGMFNTDSGGWIESKDYWLRSMTFGNNRNGFAFVSKQGTLTTSNNNAASSLGLALSYALTI